MTEFQNFAIFSFPEGKNASLDLSFDDSIPQIDIYIGGSKKGYFEEDVLFTYDTF